MTSSPSTAATSPTSAWLAWTMLRRELRDRYAGTAAGLGWALLQPVLMLGLYSLVFAFIFRIRLPGTEGPLAYVTFVAITLWPWFLLQEGLLRGMTALRAQAMLVRKTTLRRDLPVLIAVTASAMIHLAGYGVVLICLSIAGADLRISGLPLAWVTLASFLTGVMALAFLFSIVQLIWRDLEHALQPLLMILFYATPILYPISMVPESVRPVILANPLAWWAERMRAALLEGAGPHLTDVMTLLVLVAACLLARIAYLRVAAAAEDLL